MGLYESSDPAVWVVLPLAIWSFATTLTFLGTLLSLRYFGSKPPHPNAATPPLSILKPLKGLDDEAEKNLEVFFRLDYPKYELIFSTADVDDPIRPLVTRLMEQSPHIPARLISEPVEAGTNPKINNFYRAYEQAAHDWILISDSNVRVKPDYLKRLVAHVEPGVELVSAVIAGRGPKSAGAVLEATFLNTFYARWMIISANLVKPAAVGKSMLFRKSFFEKFGGMRWLSQYLAEDFMAGVEVQRLGAEVVLMTDPIGQHLGPISLGSFWSRHVRWGRIRKAHALWAFMAEPWIASIMSGLFGALAFNLWLGVSPAKFLFVHMAFWGFCDLLLARRMDPELSAWTPIAWLVRELLALPLWVHIASGNSVAWRGKRMKLEHGGVLKSY